MSTSQALPATALDTRDIAAAGKLGLTPETATMQQCSTALMLIGEPHGVKNVHVWPNGRDQIRLTTTSAPSDTQSHVRAGVMYGMVMAHLPASDCQLTDSGLLLRNYADLARALNAIAKDNPALLTKFSELQKPVAALSN